jgi:hypothetical protein
MAPGARIFRRIYLGLTATPSLHTMGFSGSNLVAQYPYERSVADGVNVPYEIFRIRTDIGEHGGAIPKGYQVPVRDKRTRAERYEELDQDLAYTAQELDRSVVVPNQIRTVLEAYRDSLFTELFPGRSEVPKTLIFCKDDHHAEEVVGITREVFGRGNDFAKKITYKTDGADPEQLIRQFRTDYNPRIAVTVDMIATGTDVKPLEVLIFLRDALVGAIGRTAVAPPELAGANTARAVGVVPLSDLVNAHWVELWLRSPAKQIEMVGKAHEVARKTLNLEDVRRAGVAIPPRLEQDRIVAIVTDLLATFDLEEASFELGKCGSRAPRKSVLKAGFEGRLVQQDPTDEPASELLACLRNSHPGNGARRQRARASADSSHPSLPGLTRLDPAIRGPAGDD